MNRPRPQRPLHRAVLRAIRRRSIRTFVGQPAAALALSGFLLPGLLLTSGPGPG